MFTLLFMVFTRVNGVNLPVCHFKCKPWADCSGLSDFSTMCPESDQMMDETGRSRVKTRIEATLNKWGFPTPMGLKHTLVMKGFINKDRQ